MLINKNKIKNTNNPLIERSDGCLYCFIEYQISKVYFNETTN